MLIKITQSSNIAQKQASYQKINNNHIYNNIIKHHQITDQGL